MLRCSPFPNMVLKSGLLRKKENVSREKVHQFAMKRFMGAGRRNPSNIIYAEFGRFPIYLNSYTKCIRYWLKLTMNTISRLPLKVYYILYNVDCKDKSILILKVRVCMAFHMHGKLKMLNALSAFFSASDKGSLTVHDKIGMIIIQSSNRFSFYKIFKTSPIVEPYFFDELQPFIKCALTKFRCGSFRYSCSP